MSSTFTGSLQAHIQLVAMCNCRQLVSRTWAEQLKPKLHAVARQIPDHRGMIFNDLNWEWAFFDAHKKLLLGKVSQELAQDIYVTDLPATTLILFEQGRYEVALLRPLSADPEKDKWLQQLKGPGLTADTLTPTNHPS